MQAYFNPRPEISEIRYKQNFDKYHLESQLQPATFFMTLRLVFVQGLFLPRFGVAVFIYLRNKFRRTLNDPYSEYFSPQEMVKSEGTLCDVTEVGMHFLNFLNF